MKPKRYIVWSTNKDIDLNDPVQRKWYIGEVLSHGRAADIAELDWDEVKRLLPELNLPKRVRRLWEDYFGIAQGERHHHTDSKGFADRVRENPGNSVVLCYRRHCPC